jgi:hypothetical protein
MNSFASRCTSISYSYVFAIWENPELLFCDDILQRGMLQRQVRTDPFEAAVLVLQFRQPLHIGGIQPTILRFPLVVCRRADAVLRQISLAGRPASASFRMDTIWVSVNFDWRIGPPGSGGYSARTFSY